MERVVGYSLAFELRPENYSFLLLLLHNNINQNGGGTRKNYAYDC